MKTISLKSMIIAVLLISVSGVVNAAGEAACRQSNDRAAGVKTSVVNAVAEFDTSSGWVNGLSNKFCKFETTEPRLGLIDLQTLTSKEPSIAATYLLNGLDMVELEKVIPKKFDGNPGTLFCQALAGSSITRYTSGGFATKEGQDEVCVFGDGSKISIWVLVYTSEDPDYLSMRKAVKSQPLAIDLPYMNGFGPTPPLAPTHLEVKAVSATRVRLTWQDNAANEQGFRIERRIGTDAWVRIAEVPADTARFVDSALTPNTVYRYRVRAFNVGGTSAYATSIAVKTPR